ncbi:MAG: tripartite tricarboxylate transporter permease [Nanoarchaeota archaeon]
MLESVIIIIVGIMIGIITGIIPGIHVNLVCAVLLSFIPNLIIYISQLNIAILITSITITHVFIDMVPSTFLSAPNTQTALAMLPAHELLMQGYGFEAVRLSVVGAFAALITGIVFIPVAWLVIPWLYNYLAMWMALVLILVVVILILSEDSATKILWASFVFMISGLLGITTFSLELNDPLLPLLSGSFGIAMIITSIREHTVLPPQVETEMIHVTNKELIGYSIRSVTAGTLTALLPGLGTSQGVVLASLAIPTNKISYILIVAGVSMINFLFSIITLVTINKARNGAIATIKELIPKIDYTSAMILIIVSVITACVAAILTMWCARLCARMVMHIKYSLICFLVLIFISTLVLILSGIPGVIVLILSTCIGLLTNITGIKKTHALGCLLIPTILYYIRI